MDIKDWLEVVCAVFGLGVVWGRGEYTAKSNADEIKEMKRQFITQDGEPRFITYPAHDKMVDNCQEKAEMKYNYLVEEIGKTQASLKRIEEILLGKTRRLDHNDR